MKPTPQTELLPPENQQTYQPMPIATREQMQIAPAPNPAEMMQAMIKTGVTQENVAAFTELVKLSEHMEDRSAKKDFARAFNALQAEMPKVKAVKSIPSKDGSVRSRFAPYEEIMDEVAPLLLKHGFTVSFSTDFKEGRIIKSCTLEHESGHSRTNTFACRIGSGPPGSSEAQGDGAASTYAKRFALCDALNIVVDVDVDARIEGAPITAAQADELEHRLKMVNGDVKRFLDFAGAKTFAEIASGKYSILDESLKKREQGKG